MHLPQKPCCCLNLSKSCGLSEKVHIWLVCMLVLFPATFYSCVVLKRVNLTEKDERIKLFIFSFLSSMLVLLFCVCVLKCAFWTSVSRNGSVEADGLQWNWRSVVVLTNPAQSCERKLSVSVCTVAELDIIVFISFWKITLLALWSRGGCNSPWGWRSRLDGVGALDWGYQISLWNIHNQKPTSRNGTCFVALILTNNN